MRLVAMMIAIATLALQASEAFLSTMALRRHAGPVGVRQSAKRVTNSVKVAAKKKEPADVEEKTGVNYGNIAMSFINPLNPYSWALYFIVGINLFAATQQQISDPAFGVYVIRDVIENSVYARSRNQGGKEVKKWFQSSYDIEGWKYFVGGFGDFIPATE